MVDHPRRRRFRRRRRRLRGHCRHFRRHRFRRRQEEPSGRSGGPPRQEASSAYPARMAQMAHVYLLQEPSAQLEQSPRKAEEWQPLIFL